MKDLTLPTLKPCPFCGAGETQMRENGRVWGGKAYGEPSSVSVVHWCVKVDGQPSRVLERVGRDKHSAIEAWNRRAALSSNHEDGGRAATDKKSARDTALEQAACLVECEYAADATQGRRLAQIAQHIRDLKKRKPL